MPSSSPPSFDLNSPHQMPHLCAEALFKFHPNNSQHSVRCQIMQEQINSIKNLVSI